MIVVSGPLRLQAGANSRGHWRTKAAHVKRERQWTRMALSSQSKPSLPVVVTLARHGVRLVDDDNLASLFKAVRDEIALWLGCGDGPSDPISWRYEQHKAKSFSVTICIEETKESGV